PVLEPGEVEAGRPQDLEVVAGVLAERRSHEALEPPGIGRSGPRPGVGEALVGEVPDDAAEVATGLGGPLRRQALGQPAEPLRDRDERAFREMAGEPRHDRQATRPAPWAE